MISGGWVMTSFDLGLELLAADRVELESFLLDVIQKDRVFEHLLIRFTQNLHPIRRRPRGSEYRPAHSAIGENNRRKTAAALRRFVTIHDLVLSRSIGQA